MRKSLVAVLTAGLLLLGVSPVWAAGKALNELALPQAAEELSDSELELIEGQWLLAAAVVVGLVLLSSLRSCSVSVEKDSDGSWKFEGDAEYGAPRWVPGR